MSYTGNLPKGPITVALSTVPGSGPTFTAVAGTPTNEFLVVLSDGSTVDSGPGFGALNAVLQMSDGGTSFPGSLVSPSYPSQVILTLSDS
jgi:hypothetical protein